MLRVNFLKFFFISFGAIAFANCGKEDRVWDNPNDPLVVEQNRKSAAPDGKNSATSMQLSFKKYVLPEWTTDFELSPSAGSMKIVKSAFNNEITFLRIERSKDLGQYFWRLNARKFKLTDEGFTQSAGNLVPTNLFSECDDPEEGQGVISFEIDGIKDKYNLIGFSEQSLPDNLTHIRIKANCKKAVSGSFSKTKLISLDTLAEDTPPSVLPLADTYGVKCSWPSKRRLISSAGELYNYRFEIKNKIPGNFSQSGSLPLGTIESCFGDEKALHIKTKDSCYSFQLTENLLFVAGCQFGNPSLTPQPFEVLHSAYESVANYDSTKTFYHIKTGSDIYQISASLRYKTNGSCSYELSLINNKNNELTTISTPTDMAIFPCESGGSRYDAYAAVGQESAFGKRIIGWSRDNKYIFLSSPIISDTALAAIQDTQVEQQSLNEKWYQDAYLQASNADPGDVFGMNVAVSGDTLAVSAWSEDSVQTTITNGTNASSSNSLQDSGAIYIYRRSGLQWTQEAYLKAANAGSYDYFGTSLSLSGETLAVGAYSEDSTQTYITTAAPTSSNNSLENSGAVYIYKRSGVNWSQEAFVKASNANISDSFGIHISLSGNTLAIGADEEDSNQNTITTGTTASSNNDLVSSGAVYVYRRNGALWEQEAYIKAANANSSDSFGWAVSISGDTLAVGVPLEDSNQTTITNSNYASSDNSREDSGAVFIYRRNEPLWTQEAFINAANASPNDQFGYSLSLSGDTLAVGAWAEDAFQTAISNNTYASPDNTKADSGAVYVYRRSGTYWTQEAYIKAANSDTDDRFGGGVSISGNTLAVGAWSEDANQNSITNGNTASSNNSLENSGAVYIYHRSETLWKQAAYIKASNANAEDRFGVSVDLSGDTLAVGAPEAWAARGSAYIFRNRGAIETDPHLRVTARTSNSITLSWHSNLGYTNRVKIAPVATGTATPPLCTATNSIELPQNITSYTYSGLSSASKYGFRVCAFDGVNVSEGATIWEDTAP